MRILVGLAPLLIASPAISQVAKPAKLPAAFVSAWNAHDPKAFERPYTPDAIWVPVARARTEGRSAIIGEFAKIHTGNGWAVKSPIALKGSLKVQMLQPNVAVVFFHIDYLSDGKPVPGVERALILVAVAEHRKWRIASGQLTKDSSPTK